MDASWVTMTLLILLISSIFFDSMARAASYLHNEIKLTPLKRSVYVIYPLWGFFSFVMGGILGISPVFVYIACGASLLVLVKVAYIKPYDLWLVSYFTLAVISMRYFCPMTASIQLIVLSSVVFSSVAIVSIILTESVKRYLVSRGKG
ncbi:MAG: hypothetical protein COB04_02600 [Gammaproteobacteria bacterium]|nr:MAG: hypothetical protein COB04_02600 [Gammaproteobacteria bacterium]